MTIRTGSASLHQDTEANHDAYAILTLWSQRGNYQAAQRLDAATVAQLRDDCARWLESETANEREAKERATCSQCLARTYRGEDCICTEGGDAEDYDVVMFTLGALDDPS